MQQVQLGLAASIAVRADQSGSLGVLGGGLGDLSSVQVQVALNNVQGTDYPYLYCVVLGKQGFRLPPRGRRHRGHLDLVYERGDGEGVSFLVIRQHADKAGGWHTEPEHISEIARVAVQEARRARRDNLEGGE